MSLHNTSNDASSITASVTIAGQYILKPKSKEKGPYGQPDCTLKWVMHILMQVCLINQGIECDLLFLEWVQHSTWRWPDWALSPVSQRLIWEHWSSEHCNMAQNSWQIEPETYHQLAGLRGTHAARCFSLTRQPFWGSCTERRPPPSLHPPSQAKIPRCTSLRPSSHWHSAILCHDC